jgi:hypothetical protein
MKTGTKIILIVAAILLGVSIWFLNSNPDSTLKITAEDFAIKDTASVYKIFLADTRNNTVKLERQDDNTWLLNGKYKARKDAVENILKFCVLVDLKRELPKRSMADVTKLMATRHTKAEFYDKSTNLIKTYYVGNATQDQIGTYMLLETPENGMIKEPIVMGMKGFIGILGPRFFTDEIEWKSVDAFNYDIKKVKQIDVKYYLDPQESFTIKYNGGNNIELYAMLKNQKVNNFDTIALKNYMLGFRSANFEIYKTEFNNNQIDSVFKSEPFAEFSVTENNNKKTTATIYNKINRASMGENLPDSLYFDTEKKYGTLDKKDLATVQVYNFGKLFEPLSRFEKK